jgi:hypothetical protein
MNSLSVRVWKDAVISHFKRIPQRSHRGTKEHHEDPRIAGNPTEIRTGYFPNTRFTALQSWQLNKDDRGSIANNSTGFALGHRVETGFGSIQSPIQWVPGALWRGKTART